MSGSFRRIAAIIRADFLLRFRRPSTLIVFLLLSAFAYVWIPAPSTGRALIQINGQRAIYNSGAIGMGTASLGMMFVGLFGYYVISNAIRRDVTSPPPRQCVPANTAVVLSFVLCAAPLVRVGSAGPHAVSAFLVGIVFVAALATSLGAITSNAKTFIVVFLSFWYVVVNDKGATALPDFAGLYGTATFGTTLVYGAVAVVALLAAQLFHRARLARA